MGLEKGGEKLEKERLDNFFKGVKRSESSGWQRKWRHEKIFLRWEK